jgi:uncharacterized protein (TIGR00369 family)
LSGHTVDPVTTTHAGRSGPFWDGVYGRVPVPPAAATLGFEYVDSDPATGTIELAFTATTDFTTPTGQVLGGFLAAMLYDTVGPVLLSTLEPDQFQSTLGLTASFLRPARPGRISAKGRVVHRDGDLAHLEAELTDAEGRLVATGTAIARVIPLGSAAP